MVNNTLQLLKQRYFDLSREFLLALQDNRSSEELETIRKEIREIISKLELLESGLQDAGQE